LGTWLDLNQVVDGTHTRELADRALGGFSLSCRFDLSMEDHASLTALHRDRIRDLRMPTSELSDPLSDLVVGTLVERGRSDFDVIGHGSHRVDTLGCSHCGMLFRGLS
jgi:hypothetical protein